MLVRKWRKGNLGALWDCKLVHPLVNSIEVPQNIKNRTIRRSSNPTSDYISKKNVITVSKLISLFITMLFILAKTYMGTT